MVAESGKVVKGIKISDEATIKKFQAIKEYLGLENDSEVVRFLVNDFLRRRKVLEVKGGFIDSDSDAEVF